MPRTCRQLPRARGPRPELAVAFGRLLRPGNCPGAAPVPRRGQPAQSCAGSPRAVGVAAASARVRSCEEGRTGEADWWACRRNVEGRGGHAESKNLLAINKSGLIASGQQRLVKNDTESMAATPGDRIAFKSERHRNRETKLRCT